MTRHARKYPVSKAALPSFGIFVASFCLYVWTTSPALGWLDSPEFVAQAATLGVAHSPGHPLPALLGRAASLIPLGDLVWRINLMSALCAAAAVTLLFACGRSLLRMVAPRISNPSATAMAMIFASLVALSWALWSNATRAEVYALQALLTAGALLGILRYQSDGRAKHLYLSSLFLGLGLANHHLMALFVLLPALVLVLGTHTRPRLQTSLGVMAIGLLGLLALCYLPIRSLAHPEVNFGAPHTLERFFWTLRGAAFSKSAYTAHVSTPLMDTVQIVVALTEALSLPLILLALIGAVGLLRAQEHRRLGLFLLALSLLCVGGRVLLGFDPQTPDHHAYLLPAIFSLQLLALAGLALLCNMALAARRPLPKAPALACIALSLMVPVQGLLHWQQSNQADAWASDDLAHWEMHALPPGGLVLVSYFQTTFRQWALHAVEGARPDLSILDRSFLSYPGMADEAKRRTPELSALIDAPLKAGEPSPMLLLAELSEQRAILVQLHINLDDALARALAPAGAFARFAAPSPMESENEDQQRRQDLAAQLRRCSAAECEEARAALLWHDATRLQQYCLQANRRAATRVYADAKALAPTDTQLKRMAEHCGLLEPPGPS